MAPPILEVCELEKRYGDRAALDRVAFQVEEGEMFGLLGPNGAGKTTLLSILSCLASASGGRAVILGRNRLVGILHGCLEHHAAYDETTAWGHRIAPHSLTLLDSLEPWDANPRPGVNQNAWSRPRGFQSPP